jgi:hypothetical protein
MLHTAATVFIQAAAFSPLLGAQAGLAAHVGHLGAHFNAFGQTHNYFTSRAGAVIWCVVLLEGMSPCIGTHIYLLKINSLRALRKADVPSLNAQKSMPLYERHT